MIDPQWNEGMITTTVEFDLAFTKASKTNTLEPGALAVWIKRVIEKAVNDAAVAADDGDPSGDEFLIRIVPGSKFTADARQR